MIPELDVVVPYDLGFVPDGPLSVPILLQNEWNAFLIFNAVQWTLDNKRSQKGIGIIEIDGYIAKFGYPNHDALGGHPLFKRGLKYCNVFEVLGSSWIQQLDAQNRIIFPGIDIFSDRRHFVFTFHDSTFECVARDIQAKLSIQPFTQIYGDITRKLLHQYSTR